MEELQLGLDGALNMSEKMEALAKGIATNTVPALWMSNMSTRVQEVGPPASCSVRARLMNASMWHQIKATQHAPTDLGSLRLTRAAPTPAPPAGVQPHCVVR